MSEKQTIEYLYDVYGPGYYQGLCYDKYYYITGKFPSELTLEDDGTIAYMAIELYDDGTRNWEGKHGGFHGLCESVAFRYIGETFEKKCYLTIGDNEIELSPETADNIREQLDKFDY